jgi:hypothetical protein
MANMRTDPMMERLKAVHDASRPSAKCGFTPAGVEAALDECRREALVCRACCEVGDLEYDPSLALLAVANPYADSDVQALMLDVDMSIGSLGLAIVKFPLPGIFSHMALVKLLDAELAMATYHRKVFGQLRTQLIIGFSRIYPL